MQLAHNLLTAFVALSALSFTLPAVASPGRSLRQHAERRATLDVCATVDASLLAWVNLILPPSSYDGCLDICLCISALPVAVETNDQLRVLANTYGRNTVIQDLTTLVSLWRLASSTPATIHLGKIRSITPQTGKTVATLSIRNQSAA